MGPIKLTINEDTVVEVEDLIDALTETPIEDGVLVMAVLDSADEALVEDLPMDHVADGLYRGVVPGSLTLSASCRYTVLVTGTAGGAPVYRREEAVARYA